MKYEYWLSALKEVNPEKRIQASMLAGGAKSFYFMDQKLVEQMHLFTEKEMAHLKRSKIENRMDAGWEECQKKSIDLITWDHPDYPKRLKAIAERPYGIFVNGHIPDDRPSVAIIGARMCSEYGRSVSSMLGKRLGEQGVQVISGMALGVDSASHTGALRGNGTTYAVLGCGPDICYPRSSRNIFENIRNSSGGILSEYAPGVEPKPYYFPQRNRIISALADLVVVVEAREKSGSLITADCALEQGKDVYAVPGRMGDELSKGCDHLIEQGAGILYDVEKFLEINHFLQNQDKKTLILEQNLLEKEESMVYSVLDLYPKFINEIIDETGLNLLSVLHAIEQLKKRKLVQETFQNYYCKTVI